MKLPQEFVEKMKSLMNENEFNDFIKTYDENRFYGLRANTLKIEVDKFKKIMPFDLENIPWTKDGFYYRYGDAPGRHPYYHAGLYYIQEPSAMFPAELMDAKPGEKILDLCAAPGGKTVQLAAGMKGQGILISNDVSSNRIKALIKNIELCGIENAIVTNETPEKLVNNFQEYFDGILVDAPCSGEGMFRKDEDAANSWGKFKCDKCADMQQDILKSAAKMLKPGGRLVYSTCTFSPEEDEIMISNFLKENPEYSVDEIPAEFGMENGRPEWADNDINVKGTIRLWPHKIRGEGHFAAKLKKSFNNKPHKYTNNNFNADDKTLTLFREFVRENLINYNEKLIFSIGSNLYSLPEEIPDLTGIKVAKFGCYLGSPSIKGFEPSHSFLLSLQQQQLLKKIDYNIEDNDIVRYLKGETIFKDAEKGYVAICCDGFPLGWVKSTGEMLKNLYPKGWRKLS